MSTQSKRHFHLQPCHHSQNQAGSSKKSSIFQGHRYRTKSGLVDQKFTNVPDNLCYCREGQRQCNMPKEELETWKEALAHSHDHGCIIWIQNETRMGWYLSHFTLGTKIPSQALTLMGLRLVSEATAESDQLMYFLDLAHFELAGRSSKTYQAKSH